MTDYAIVIVGYNRISSMLRTLESARKADYLGDRVDLIISLDNSGDLRVKEAADAFEWPHGDKKVRLLPERAGLRKHILSCGDFLNDYNAIAVLEDDIIVAPGFYSYMKNAVNYYGNDDNIAGISLYGFEWNPNFNSPFCPQKTSYDTYFMQFAQSWGQIWMKESFFKFRKWYEENTDCFDKPYDGVVPKSVYGWPASSWLKYHIMYCCMENKYFVYPYSAYSSNFTEKGEHYTEEATRFQVSLQHDVIKEYKFAPFLDGVKYDSYFENEGIAEVLDIADAKVAVDIYGSKPVPENTGYFLSSQVLNYKIVKSFGLSMRPQEDNILYNTQGDNIFLYDLTCRANNPKKKKEQIADKWNYYSREKFVMLDEAFPVAVPKFKNLIKTVFTHKK